VLTLDGLADEMERALEAYRGPAAEHLPGTGACSDLQAAYLAVENAWFDYNVQGISKTTGDLDPARNSRHNRLSREVRAVEIAYTGTGCPRP
jgi:hypothetical protein